MAMEVEGSGRAALRAELETLRARYNSACLALHLFVEDSLDNIPSRQQKLGELIETLAGAEPGIIDADADSLAVTPNDDGTLTIQMDVSTRDVMQAALMESRESYDVQPQLLFNMALSHAFALFDALLADVLLATLCAVPEQLRSKATLTYEEALAFPTRDALVMELARRRVLSLMYGNLEGQLDYFSRAFGVDPAASSGFDLARLLELRDRRNLIVHNNGRASSEYALRYGVSAGQDLTTDAERARGDRSLLAALGSTIATQVQDHFVSPEDR